MSSGFPFFASRLTERICTQRIRRTHERMHGIPSRRLELPTRASRRRKAHPCHANGIRRKAKQGQLLDQPIWDIQKQLYQDQHESVMQVDLLLQCTLLDKATERGDSRT